MTAPVGTHGFLFADLRGYTAYLDRRGAAAAAELLDRFRKLVRAAVAAHDGAEIRTEGDSFYVVFPSASKALACALEIVRAADDVSIGGERIPVGIGVHAGEALETPEGPVGTAVNIAARLCAMAAPGEVLVSDTVRALTRSVGAAGFVRLGRRSIKGLDEALTLYRALPAGAPVPAPRLRSRPMPYAAAAVGLAAVVLAVLLLPGVIGGTAGSSPATTGSAIASASESGNPSASPSGLFASRNFAVPFTITLTPDWGVFNSRADVVAYIHRPRPTGWIDIILVNAVLDPPCIDSTPEFIGERPQDLIEWLSQREWLTVGAPRPYNVGPYLGRAIDVEFPTGAVRCREGPEVSPFRLGARAASDEFGSTWGAEPGERKRVIALDVSGRTITAILGSPYADVEQFWRLAEPLLQSIRFETP